MIPLTSPSLLLPDWVEAAGYGLCLGVAGPDGPLRLRVERTGIAREADLKIPKGLEDRLLVFAGEGPGPAPVAGEVPTARPGWKLLWEAERVREAALAGDWERMGAAVDRGWLAQRAVLGSNAWDLLYASARSAGAWGGFFSARGVVVLTPAEAEARVTTVFREKGWATWSG